MSNFEHIYDALQLYKEDPVFLMAVPDVKEMLDVLEKGGIKVRQCFDTFQLYYDGVEN